MILRRFSGIGIGGRICKCKEKKKANIGSGGELCMHSSLACMPSSAKRIKSYLMLLSYLRIDADAEGPALFPKTWE
jgi:hypothetical protein